MTSDAPVLPFDPFAARAVGDPWRSPEPDIASINAKAFDKIIALLNQIHLTQNLSALVLGEAGSGKTHLIKRLMTVKSPNLIFVYVHPMKNPAAMFSNLLERVMANLDCSLIGFETSSECSQLDLIVANVIVAALEENLKLGYVKIRARDLDALKSDPIKILQQKKGLIRQVRTWRDVVRRS